MRIYKLAQGLVQAGSEVDWSRLKPVLLADSAPEVRAEAIARLGELESTAKTSNNTSWLTLTRKEVPQVRLQALLANLADNDVHSLLESLADKDPFLACAAQIALGRPGRAAMLLKHVHDPQAAIRLGLLVSLRRTCDVEARAALPGFLADPEPAIRQVAIQWVAEDHLVDFVPQLEKAASQAPVTRGLFEALLAARQILAGVKLQPKEEVGGQDYIATIVADKRQPLAFRKLGLSLLRPDHPALRPELLREFLSSKEPGLAREAVRTLRLRTDAPAQDLLRALAADGAADRLLRAEAIGGLAGSADALATQRLLVKLLAEDELARDALRSLREVKLPADLDGERWTWWEQA